MKWCHRRRRHPIGVGGACLVVGRRGGDRSLCYRYRAGRIAVEEEKEGVSIEGIMIHCT